MLFNTLAYAWFLGVVFLGSWALVRWRRLRLFFLLAASYYFYAQWDVRFLPLIWGSSTADFLLAKKIHATLDPVRRKRWLWGTVVLNLGVLGFFKYFNFGIESARALCASLGYDVPSVVLHIALPVGISFFTFESMSYVIDVYRKELVPCTSYVEYLTFVAFFPHLVAGPIVRPKDLLPQLNQPGHVSAAELGEGLFLIAVGLGKKIIIGDYLALNLVDRVFDAPLQYSAVENYAAVLGYALQIYCDFSGYTDIAIGSALLLGVRFPLNFNAPYKAVSIVDFWRRWHISLSSWLRDYLYIPLGGNRLGPRRTYVNLLMTMVLGGLWHGAAWTFVIWGALHGALLAINKWLDDHLGVPHGWWARLGAAVVTFHLVCVGWVFFRAADLSHARLIFARLFSGTLHHQNLPASVLGVLALGLVSHVLPESWFARTKSLFIGAPFVVQGVALALVAMVLRRMASADAVPFVYFQF